MLIDVTEAPKTCRGGKTTIFSPLFQQIAAIYIYIKKDHYITTLLTPQLLMRKIRA